MLLEEARRRLGKLNVLRDVQESYTTVLKQVCLEATTTTHCVKVEYFQGSWASGRTFGLYLRGVCASFGHHGRPTPGGEELSRSSVDFFDRNRLDPLAEEESLRKRERNVRVRRRSADQNDNRRAYGCRDMDRTRVVGNQNGQAG